MTRKPVVVIATKNEKKKRELLTLLKNTGVRLLTLRSYPGFPEVREDCRTFAGNARRKALAAARYTGRVAVGDDSGLEVKCLAGRPGVLSARFAGPGAVDRDNNAKLLGLLKKVKPVDRKARFVCSIAVARPDGMVKTARGTCRGSITLRARGKTGFGYDPVFVPGSYRNTFAELGPRIKNRISHRARALKKARPLILSLLKKSVVRE